MSSFSDKVRFITSDTTFPNEVDEVLVLARLIDKWGSRGVKDAIDEIMVKGTSEIRNLVKIKADN